MVLVLGCFWIKFRGVKPLAEIDYSSDVENLNAEYYPMVLLQIPMCNEREVRRCMFSSSHCQKSIIFSSKHDMLSEFASLVFHFCRTSPLKAKCRGSYTCFLEIGLIRMQSLLSL